MSDIERWIRAAATGLHLFEVFADVRKGYPVLNRYPFVRCGARALRDRHRSDLAECGRLRLRKGVRLNNLTHADLLPCEWHARFCEIWDSLSGSMSRSAVMP